MPYLGLNIQVILKSQLCLKFYEQDIMKQLGAFLSNLFERIFSSGSFLLNRQEPETGLFI